MPGGLSPLPGLRRQAERLLEERTRALAGRAAGSRAQPSVAVLACGLGEEFCALPLHAVLRILSFVPCAPLPGTSPAMLGVCGQGGMLFNVLDLAAALSRGAAGAAPAGGHLLLLRHTPRRFALRVDRALGLARLPAALPFLAAEDAATPVTAHAPLPAELAGELPAGRRPVMSLIDPHHLLRPYLAQSHAAPEAET